jgi:hypothetical protein
MKIKIPNLRRFYSTNTQPGLDPVKYSELDQLARLKYLLNLIKNQK